MVGKEQEKTQDRTRVYMGAVPGNRWGDFQRVPPIFFKGGKIGGGDETSTLFLHISRSTSNPAPFRSPTQCDIPISVSKCESSKAETHSSPSSMVFLYPPPSVERKPREEKRGDPGETPVAPSRKLQPKPQPQTVGSSEHTKFSKSKGDLPKIVFLVTEGPQVLLKLKVVKVKPKFSPHQARKKVPGEAGGTRPPGMS